MITKYLGLLIISLFCSISLYSQTESDAQVSEGASRGARGAIDTRITTLQYNSGQVGLDEPSLREIKRVIRLMRINPDIRMSVQGHTDDKGEILENQRLSEFRAWLVWAYMVSNGVPHHRVEYVGFGFRKPKVGDVTEEARKENRRVEIHLMKK